MVLILMFLIFVGFVGLIVFLIIYSHKKEKERTLAMQQAAASMGWQFAPTADMNMIPHTNYFNLFNQGHSKSIRNMIYGQMNGVKTAIFDYRYTVGHGKHSHTYNQTIVYFETPKLQLPMFTLSPEGFMHKFISALGYQDIDFAQRPEFSKRYLLRGPDEGAIRQTFQDNVLAFYEANQGLHTEGGGNQLFVYRLSYRVPPHEATRFVQWGEGAVLNLFRRPW